METIDARLAVRREALLRQYQAEDLHQLRIDLRRIRAFLKQRSGKKARRLRHELGKLADTTNAVRDWDTLLARATGTLGPDQSALLERHLLQRQAAAHLPVRQMLEGEAWAGTLGQWRRYIARHPPRKADSRSGRKSVRRARDKVAEAWQRASAVDSARNWHRLRIALKELRYRLEMRPKNKRSGETRRLLQQCRQLQRLLGDWHDTVVHQQLLRELAHALDPEADADTLRALQAWCREIEVEGRHSLELARQALASPALHATIGAFNRAST